MVRRAVRIVALGDTMAARLVHGKGADQTQPRGHSQLGRHRRDRAAGQGQRLRVAPTISRGRFVVLHAGNIGFAESRRGDRRGSAAAAIEHDIVILFIGDGNRRAALEAARGRGGSTTSASCRFSRANWCAGPMRSSDVCLVSLKRGLAGYIVPSKLYPILAAGRAVLAAVEEASETAAIVRNEHCGRVVPVGDSDALARAVVALADDPASRSRFAESARKAALNYSRTRQVAAHAHVLRGVSEAGC